MRLDEGVTARLRARYVEAQAYAERLKLPAVADFCVWCVEHEGVHLRDAAIAHLCKMWGSDPINNNVSREQLAAGAIWEVQAEGRHS